MSANGKPKKPVKPKGPKPMKHTSNLGHKPKAPKPQKPKVEDAIEVEATEVISGEKPSMSLKELIDSNTNIRTAVNELQAQNIPPNRDNIKAKLLDLNEMGKISISEYKECKELLE